MALPPIIKWPDPKVARSVGGPRSGSGDYLWLGAGGLLGIGLLSFFTAYLTRHKPTPIA